MSEGKYKWQGEPVKVTFGSCTVKANKDKPLYWYNYECLQFSMDGFYTFPALLVEYGEQNFVLSNHYGIGISKLLQGGWPNHSHFSLPDIGFKNNDDNNITVFDQKGFKAYEKDRKNWQKKMYPEEYKKSENLIKMAAKMRAGF